MEEVKVTERAPVREDEVTAFIERMKLQLDEVLGRVGGARRELLMTFHGELLDAYLRGHADACAEIRRGALRKGNHAMD